MFQRLLLTCTEPGIAAGSECAVCHKVISGREVIPAKGHDKELVKHAAVAATCVATGNKEYYECKSCGQLFSDKGGKTETTLEAVTTEINPSNHAEKLTKVAGEGTDLRPRTATMTYCDVQSLQGNRTLIPTDKDPIQNPDVTEKLGHDLRNSLRKKDADGKEIWTCSRIVTTKMASIASGRKDRYAEVRISGPHQGHDRESTDNSS